MGAEFCRFLHFLQGGDKIVPGGIEIGNCDVTFWIIRLFGHQEVSLVLRLLEVATCNQQVGEIDPCLIVVGVNFNGPGELLISASPFLEFQISLCQMIVGLDETGIHLDCIAELNGRLAIFCFFEITLAAFKIFLFADVGVPRTTNQHRGGKTQNQNQTESAGMPHQILPMRRANYANRFSRVASTKVLQVASQRK